MDPTRTVMSIDGEIVGELIFIIQGDHASPCIRTTDSDMNRMVLVPWSKLRLAPELFVLDMTKQELFESEFPELPAHLFPSSLMLRRVRQNVVQHDGTLSLN
jgi:hypothetical protein